MMGTSKDDVLWVGPSRAQRRFKYMGDESHAEVVLALTGETRAFESGYSFFVAHEFSIPSAATRVIKIVSTVNTVVRLLQVDLQTVTLTLSLEVGGTEGGTFDQPITVRTTNQQSTVPTRSAGVTMNYGGTHTGGTVIDKYFASAEKGSEQAISDDLPIGFAAGTFYIHLTNTGNQTATGVFRARWEVRPNGNS
jgi:hypothetical protein